LCINIINQDIGSRSFNDGGEREKCKILYHANIIM